jgi:hypothetical protein
MNRKPLALAAALALAVLAPAAHAAVVPGEAIDGPSSAIQHFNDLDMAPDGTGALVYTKHVGIVDDIFVSTYNGSAWSTPQDISTASTCNCGQGRVAAGNGGRVVVTYVDVGGTLRAVLRPNAGAAFGTPDSAAPGSAGEVGGDDVDMDPVSGVAYAVIDQAGQHVRATRLSGTTWTEVNGAGALGNLDGPTDDTGIASGGEQNTARVAVDSAGNAVVAWPAKDTGGTGAPHVYVRRVTGTTAAVSSIEATVPSFAGHDDSQLSADMITIDGGGSPNPWIAFRELFKYGAASNFPRDLTRQLVGNTFSAAQALDGLPNDTPTEGAEYPQIDINAAGQGIVGMPRQLSFQAFGSQLVAGTWATGFRLDSGTPSAAPFATAAIADSGNGLVAWNDSGGTTPQISARQDVGGVLGAPFVVSKAGAGDLLTAPDAPIVASSSSAGAVAVGFGQSNGGSNSVVVAIVDLPQPPPGGGGGGGTPTPKPAVQGLSLSRTTFAQGSRLATISRKRRGHKVGTTISFTVSVQSSTRLSFAQRTRGFRSGKRCVAHRPKGHRKAKRCTRYVKRGSLPAFTTAAGSHKVHFEGRLGRKKRLKPGRYRLSVVSSNSSGKSPAKRASFRLLRK